MLLDRKVDKEYAGIMGYDFFRKEAYKLAFGEDQNFKDIFSCPKGVCNREVPL